METNVVTPDVHDLYRAEFISVEDMYGGPEDYEYGPEAWWFDDIANYND
jgi:hypothetical protein